MFLISQSYTLSKICRRLGHFYLSVLYLVQTAVSYLLMLAVMSFNVWIMVAVVAGATLGHRQITKSRTICHFGSEMISDH